MRVQPGSKIKYKGSWGFDPYVREAEVTSIHIDTESGRQDGREVESIDVDELKAQGRDAVINLNNNKWIYGFQIV